MTLQSIPTPIRPDHANLSERTFGELAHAKGWHATKRGWPDFLCFSDDGEVIAVEVKPRNLTGQLKLLKRDQAACMDFLMSHGVRCFVSDGVTLEPYRREIHAAESRRRTGPRS